MWRVSPTKWSYISFCCAFLLPCQNTPKCWEVLIQVLLLLFMPVLSLPTDSIFWRATHFHVSWLNRRQVSFFQVCLRQVCFFLLLSHLFSTFHSCCSLCVPMLPHWPIPPSQCRVWELSPLKQIFPSLKSLGALSLQGPGNKVYSGPRPAGVQEAKLPFQVQRRSHH